MSNRTGTITDARGNFAIESSSIQNTFAKLNVTSSKTNKNAKRLVRNKSAINELLGTLDRSPRFTKMIEYSVGLFKSMAVDEVCVEELIEEGVLEALMKIQKLNPYNEAVNRVINDCIASFCLNDHCARLVAERIGSGNLIFSLKKHVEPETVSASCHAMARMMRIEESVDMFVSEGAVDALDYVAIQMKTQPEVMASVAECLKYIVRNPAYIPLILQTSLLQNLLEALANNPDNANLVQHALQFLATIAEHAGEHIDLLKKLGVVDMIVAALEAHSDSKVILNLGAKALKNLADEDDMLSALKVVPTVNEETANALSKLASLMLVEENVQKMLDNHGIEWLVTAMKAAVNSPYSETSGRIMISGSHAMNRICIDEMKIYELVQKGGVSVLMDCVNAHGEHENILVAALHAIARVITRKENADYVLNYGIMKTIEKARTSHPTSNRVANPVADICERLTRHHDLHTRIIGDGIIPTIKTMLEEFMADKDIVKLCLTALQHLAETREGADALIKANIGELIAKVLAKYPDDAEIVKTTLSLLSNMAKNSPDAAEHFRATGVIKAVANALDRLSKNGEVQELGTEFMKLLEGEVKLQLKEVVANVWSTSKHMIANPDQAEVYAERLKEAVALLNSLCLSEANHAELLQCNAQAALQQAIVAAIPLQESENKTIILTEAAQGMDRLLNLAESDRLQPMIAQQYTESGTLMKLMEFIRTTTGDEYEDAAELAMTITANCSQYASTHKKFINDGIVANILGIAKQYPYNDIIQTDAVDLLDKLYSDPLAAEQIIKAGGAKTIIDALYANINEPEKLVKTLNMITSIATDPVICGALWDAGILDALLQVWRKQQDNSFVVKSCVTALTVMLVSEVVGTEMGEKGVLDLAIPAIRKHYKVSDLVEDDVVMLDSLATIRPNAIKLLDEDFATCDLMKWVQRKYKDQQNTVDAADRIINTLEALQFEMDEEIRIQREKEEKANAEEVKQLIVDIGNGAVCSESELHAMFKQLELLLADNSVVKTLALNGGLHAMSKLMLAHKDNEEIFKSATSLFMKMSADCEDDEILDLLEETDMVGAQSEVLKPHPNFNSPIDELYINQAVTALGKIKFNDSTAEQLANNGTLGALTQILTSSENQDILREIGRILGKASRNEHAMDVMTKGFTDGSNGFTNIRQLIDAMRKNMDNIEFLRFGIYLLACLACTEGLKDEIGIQSGVLLITEVNRKYEDEFNLVKNCTYALAQLTFEHEVNCAFVMASKGIPLTISMMELYMHEPELLENACCILGNMCYDNDHNKTLIIRHGGASIIVDTVLRNFDQLDVMLKALATLGVLAYNSNTVDAILRAGGVQGIVATMTVLGDNVLVPDAAIRVLKSLAAFADDDHMKIMAEEGAVQAIVEVFAAHTNNVEIALNCVIALCDLSVSMSNSDLIIKQGGCEVVIAALSMLGNDADFVEMAIRLLFNLTYSVNNLNRIINAGVCRAVLYALQNQLNALQVISIGLRTINNLCYTDEVAVALADDGPIEFIIQLFHNALVNPTSGSEAIMTECTLALSSLCRPEPNALAMAMNATQLCISALRQYSSNYLLCKDVCAFLANLFVHAGAAIAASEHDVIQEILRMITIHINNPDLLLIACKPIENMTYASQGIRDHMKSLQVIEKMNEVIEVNFDREDVRKVCHGVIYAVNRTEFVAESLDFVQLTRSRKNLKDVFEAIGEKREERQEVIAELPPKIKNFLTAGALLVKHSRTAAPRPRHVYVTDDLKWLVWKDPKERAIDPEQRMKIFKISTVERGRCTFQLQRKSFGKHLAEEKFAFSIQGRERTVDLEASSEKERERWVDAIEHLIAYKKSMQSLQQKAAQFF